MCAYLRGGERARRGARAATGDATIARRSPGRWRDVLAGGERDLGDEVAVAELVDPYGLGLFERL